MTKPIEQYSASSVITKAFSQAAIFAVGSLCLSFGQIAIAPLLTRHLSVHEFGIYEILLTSYIMAKGLLIIPLSSALVYGYCKYCELEEERKRLLGTMGLLSIFISVVCFMSGVIIPQWPAWLVGSQEDLNSVGALILFSLGFETMVQMALGSLRAALKPVLYGVVALNQFIATLVLIILFVGVYDFGLQGVFGSFLLANLATNILLIPIMRRRISWRLNWEAAKPVINFAVTLIPLSLASLVLSSSDRYFLNYFSGLATLGVYGLTYRIGNGAAMLVAVPFTTAWPATIYAEKDSKRIGELVSKAALSLLTVGLLFIVMVSSASKPLLLLFGGNNYIEGANLIPMIAAGAIFFAEAGIFFTALVAHGFLRRQMYSLLGISALALALNSFFIPTYGIVGAALATLLTYTLALGLSVLMAGRVVPLNCQISKRIKILLSAVVAIILGKLMQDSSAIVVVNLLSASLISVLTYVFLLVIFRIIRLREWNLLKLRQSYAKLS